MSLLDDIFSQARLSSNEFNASNTPSTGITAVLILNCCAFPLSKPNLAGAIACSWNNEWLLYQPASATDGASFVAFNGQISVQLEASGWSYLGPLPGDPVGTNVGLTINQSLSEPYTYSLTISQIPFAHSPGMATTSAFLIDPVTNVIYGELGGLGLAHGSVFFALSLGGPASPV